MKTVRQRETSLGVQPVGTRIGLGALLLVAMALSGCGLSTTPFDPAQSCQAVGGTYTSGGICRAGSA